MSVDFYLTKQKSRQRGMALLAVISVSILVLLVGYFVLMNSQRYSQTIKNNNDDLKFIEITSRLKNILSTRALCTCNLKDTIILPNGTITFSSRMRIDEGPTARPELFGFYQLKEVGGDRGCNTVTPIVNYDEDAVVSFRPSANYKSAVKAKYAEVSGFELINVISASVARYKAKLTFAAKDNFSAAKSNIHSPIEFDVFVEVDSTTGENIIKQCFQPSSSSLTPSPFVPSPPSSSCPCRWTETSSRPASCTPTLFDVFSPCATGTTRTVCEGSSIVTYTCLCPCGEM